MSQLLSIIIVSYNVRALLKKCLTHTIHHATGLQYEIWVIDNGSTDGTADMLKNEFSDLHLILNKDNKGFAKANNQALRQCRGTFTLLLNPDAFISQDTLPKTLAYMKENQNCAILGALLVSDTGEPQPSARKFLSVKQQFYKFTGLEKYFNNGNAILNEIQIENKPVTVDWVPGAYFLVRASIFKEIGYLDERFFLYAEEMDFCYQVKKKLKKDIICYPFTKVIHLSGASAKKTRKKALNNGHQSLEIHLKSELQYFQKNSGTRSMILVASIQSLAYLISVIKNLCLQKKEKVNDGVFALKTILRTVRLLTIK